MTVYRAVLTPPQESWPAYFALTAPAKYLADDDGYCMTEGRSVPHVTLCKFNVPEGADVEKIWTAIKSLPPPDVVFDRMDIRGGKDPESASQWPMLINAGNNIFDYQEKVVKAIAAAGGIPESDGKYDPHLTLLSTTKLGGDDEVLKNVLGDVNAFINKPLPFNLAIGHTIPGGQVPEIFKVSCDASVQSAALTAKAPTAKR